MTAKSPFAVIEVHNTMFFFFADHSNMPDQYKDSPYTDHMKY